MDKDKHILNHFWGAAGTLLIHGLLLFLFIAIIFRTPIPPWPEEGGGGGGSGLEINLGNSNDGMGQNQYADLNIPSFTNKKTAEPAVPPKALQEIKAKNTQADDVLTQDNEESVNIPSKVDKPDKKKKVAEVVNQPVQPVVVKQPVVNQNALYRKSKNNNDGITGKPGNQGREDGTKSSANYKGTGTGQGTGDGSGKGSGSGSGSGSGIGSGMGGGIGSGTSYDLGGRTARNLPKPEYNSPEQGRVVVAIWVNKSGQVVKALSGAKGTTISDVSLRKLAENAARRATFSPDQNAAEEQHGTITYIFVKLNK